MCVNNSLNSGDGPWTTKRRRACLLIHGLARGSPIAGVAGFGFGFARAIGKQHLISVYSVSASLSLWRGYVTDLSSMPPYSSAFWASWGIYFRLARGEGCALLLGGCAVHDCGGSGQKDRIAGRNVRKKRLWGSGWRRGSLCGLRRRKNGW